MTASPGFADLTPLARSREQRAWYWYDWANSAYVTTIAAVLFAPYLTSVAEVAAYVQLPARLARLLTRRVAALQVPHRVGRLTVASPRLVRRAHAAGVPVHVWTIDDPDEMRLLLDRGVDGLMTDRTDILRSVLVERGRWSRDPREG